jgi:hypothetical protein
MTWKVGDRVVWTGRNKEANTKALGPGPFVIDCVGVCCTVRMYSESDGPGIAKFAQEWEIAAADASPSA